jgi:hypothetical protein
LIGIDTSVRLDGSGLLTQQTIDARPADAAPARDCCRAERFLTAEPHDLDSIDRRLATLIDATHLCGIDPLQLAFTKLHRVNPQAYLTDVLTKLVNN